MMKRKQSGLLLIYFYLSWSSLRYISWKEALWVDSLKTIMKTFTGYQAGSATYLARQELQMCSWMRLRRNLTQLLGKKLKPIKTLTSILRRVPKVTTRLETEVTQHATRDMSRVRRATLSISKWSLLFGFTASTCWHMRLELILKMKKRSRG